MENYQNAHTGVRVCGENGVVYSPAGLLAHEAALAEARAHEAALTEAATSSEGATESATATLSASG